MRWATLKSWMKPRRGRMLETTSSNKPSEGLTLLPHSVLLLLLLLHQFVVCPSLPSIMQQKLLSVSVLLLVITNAC